MGELTYEDFKSRLSIKTVLEDAGYHFNRRDGYKCPAFVNLDSNGRRIRGDKFIVTTNGLCCYRPPERRNYNVISFIKEFPEKFAEYKPGMDMNRLVNLVCNRLLNNPTVYTQYDIKENRPEQVFDESAYELMRYDTGSWDNRKKFYPFLKDRGIDLNTQAVFADYFFLAKNIGRADGRQFVNLAFPFRIPNDETKIVGLEERGRRWPDFPNAKIHKAKATGTNSVEGLWFANLSRKPLAEAERVLWFESGFDAFANFQINRDKGKDTKGVYTSTGGNPGEKQFRGMIDACPNATHYLGFDRDRAGLMYACTFAAIKAGRIVSSYSMKDGTFVFIDKTTGYERYEIPSKDFTYEKFCNLFGFEDPKVVYYPAAEGYKDWNDQLLGKRMNVEVQEEDSLSETEEEKRSNGFRR